jgi:hypothetical protein
MDRACNPLLLTAADVKQAEFHQLVMSDETAANVVNALVKCVFGHYACQHSGSFPKGLESVQSVLQLRLSALLLLASARVLWPLLLPSRRLKSLRLATVSSSLSFMGLV